MGMAKGSFYGGFYPIPAAAASAVLQDWKVYRYLDFRTLTPTTLSASGAVDTVEFNKFSGGNLVIDATEGLSMATSAEWHVEINSLPNASADVAGTDLSDWGRAVLIVEKLEDAATIIGEHGFGNYTSGTDYFWANIARAAGNQYVQVSTWYPSANQDTNSGVVAEGTSGFDRSAVQLEGKVATMWYDDVAVDVEALPLVLTDIANVGQTVAPSTTADTASAPPGRTPIFVGDATDVIRFWDSSVLTGNLYTVTILVSLPLPL